MDLARVIQKNNSTIYCLLKKFDSRKPTPDADILIFTISNYSYICVDHISRHSESFHTLQSSNLCLRCLVERITHKLVRPIQDISEQIDLKICNLAHSFGCITKI